jgi:hypothetical protein
MYHEYQKYRFLEEEFSKAPSVIKKEDLGQYLLKKAPTSSNSNIPVVDPVIAQGSLFSDLKKGIKRLKEIQSELRFLLDEVQQEVHRKK